MPLACAAMALPLAAEANAGTPLMWSTTVHLVFGNLLIGVAEGLMFAEKEMVGVRSLDGGRELHIGMAVRGDGIGGCCADRQLGWY